MSSHPTCAINGCALPEPGAVLVPTEGLKEYWGRCTWTQLHQYARKGSEKQKILKVLDFLRQNYPCLQCKANLCLYLRTLCGQSGLSEDYSVAKSQSQQEEYAETKSLDVCKGIYDQLTHDTQLSTCAAMFAHVHGKHIIWLTHNIVNFHLPHKEWVTWEQAQSKVGVETTSAKECLTQETWETIHQSTQEQITAWWTQMTTVLT